MRTDILQALGLTALAGVLIGGMVIAVAICKGNKNSAETVESEPEKPSNQPVVTEEVRHSGWEEIEEEEFNKYEDINDAELNPDYKVAYFTVYSDGYGVVDMPNNSICVTPTKMSEQEYIPQRILDTATAMGAFWKNYDTKTVWMVYKVSYSFKSTLSWPSWERDST